MNEEFLKETEETLQKLKDLEDFLKSEIDRFEQIVKKMEIKHEDTTEN